MEIVTAIMVAMDLTAIDRKDVAISALKDLVTVSLIALGDLGIQRVLATPRVKDMVRGTALREPVMVSGDLLPEATVKSMELRVVIAVCNVAMFIYCKYL